MQRMKERGLDSIDVGYPKREYSLFGVILCIWIFEGDEYEFPTGGLCANPSSGLKLLTTNMVTAGLSKSMHTTGGIVSFLLF